MMLIQLMLSTFSNQNQAVVTGSKAEVPASATQATTTDEKRKEGSSDAARPSTSATYSSPRLERILSSPSEQIEQVEEPADTGSVTRDNIETVPTVRVSSRAAPADAENSSSRPCSSSMPSTSAATASCSSNSCPVPPKCATDSVPLAKATRNLTQTLQKLSSEVMTSKKVSTVQVNTSKGSPFSNDVIYRLTDLVRTVTSLNENSINFAESARGMHLSVML